MDVEQKMLEEEGQWEQQQQQQQQQHNTGDWLCVAVQCASPPEAVSHSTSQPTVSLRLLKPRAKATVIPFSDTIHVYFTREKDSESAAIGILERVLPIRHAPPRAHAPPPHCRVPTMASPIPTSLRISGTCGRRSVPVRLMLYACWNSEMTA